MRASAMFLLSSESTIFAFPFPEVDMQTGSNLPSIGSNSHSLKLQQYKTVSLPVQPLDSVPPPPTEQKQRIAEWVQLKLLLYQAGQSVYSSPQIRVPASYVHMIRSLKICQHSFSAWMMARIVSASAPACISIRSSPLSMLAAVPLPAGLLGISAKHTSASVVTV